MRLDPEQRVAGVAAGALLVTLFLPWYDATVVQRGVSTTPTFSGFGEFSFVEAAILLVALGVFVLLWARSQRKPFHLPGGDGTVIFAAGLWAAVLLLWRVFDRPDVPLAVNVGIQWGFFFAFIASAGVAAAGWRIRVAARPEPPNPAASPLPEPPRRRPIRERPVRPDLSADAPEFDIPPRRDRPADPAEEITRRLPPAPDEEEPPTRRLFEDPARGEDDRPHPDQLGFDDEPTRRLP